jgi:kanamycin nucleotidyltransferase
VDYNNHKIFTQEKFHMTSGPQFYTHAERMKRVEEIAGQLRAHFGPQLLALGLYGSVARGTDGPYSDIELYAIIQGEGVDYAYEWSAGPWKAEVDVHSPDTLLAWAAELDGLWSLTHKSALTVQLLEDPQGIFARMAAVATQHSDEEIAAALAECIVGELYELVGKVRNAVAERRTASLALFTVELTRYAAGVVGLAQRHLYPSAAEMLEDSLRLPDPPEGYPALCRLVISGRLDDPQEILARVDAYWAGVEAWAVRRGLVIETTLETLLKNSGD